jgi:hypothetical protein
VLCARREPLNYPHRFVLKLVAAGNGSTSMIVTPLDRASRSKLSRLQKRLLLEGLKAYPVGRASRNIASEQDTEGLLFDREKNTTTPP